MLTRRTARIPSLLLLLIGMVGQASGAPPAIHLIGEDADGLSLHFALPPWDADSLPSGEIIPDPAGSKPVAVAGWPAVPFYSALIAVPPDGEVRIEAMSIRSEETGEHRIAPFPRLLEDGSAVFEWADDVPAGFFPAPWHEISAPTFLRDQRIVAVTIYPVRYDRNRGVTQVMREAELHVRFVREKRSPAPEGGGRIDPLERLFRGTLLNARSPWATWDAPRRAPAKLPGDEDSFASSADWIRMEIAESGFYAIEYEDLVDLGVVDPRTEIGDPRTIRLYTGSGLPLPESLSADRPDWMEQVAIHLAGEEDGSFDPEDRIEFYALSSAGWLGEFRPDSSAYYDHQDHPYTDRNVYWLTWGGSFSEPVAARVQTVPATAGRGPDDGHTNLATFSERFHSEEDFVQDLTRYGEDGWFWEKFSPTNDEGSWELDLEDADESAPGSIKIRFYHYSDENSWDPCGTERIWTTVNGDAFDVWQYNSCETVGAGYAPRDFEGSGFPVMDGTNRVDIRVGLRKKVYLAWIEVGYPRFLRAVRGELHFRIDEPGDYRVPIAGFEGEGARLFDVTDFRNVREIGGLGASADSAVAILSLDEPATYHVVAPEAWKNPFHMERRSPAELRSPSSGAEYLIIAFDPFLSAAQKLAAHRADRFPSMAVSLSDVYDQFSWGLPDPFAVRDFLAHALYRWPEGERPAYVLLLGDATSDFRNRIGSAISCDLPAPYYVDPVGSETQTYASDELLTYLDPGAAGEEDWAPDIAIGRLPANSVDEANGMVEKIIEYDRSPERGGWRNSLLFSADDQECGHMLVFTTDSEDLLERFPESLHRERVYSVEYPLEGYGKPEAHGAVIDRLREGCLIANYVGHGSVDKLSDEEILVIRDAAQKAIRNEGRQPLFLAWSCSVGSFDLLDRDCLAEAFLKTRGGGMVGAIAATAPTFAGVSRALGMELYSRLFPTAHSRVPVGAALMMAKAVAGGSHNAQKINDQKKYNLLGDPALVLGAPLLDISLENPLPLPMTRGEKVTLSGAVRDTLGVLVEGFSGEAEITVYGRADTSGFTWVDTTCTGNPGDPTIRRASYPLLGPLLFRGKATVTGGAFEASFIVPMDTPTGPLARIDIYAHSEESGADGATGTDSVLVLPETGASGGDGEGPRIDITVNGSPLEEWIWFTRNSPFHVEIEDESGLNLQRTDPYFSIHLVFDRGDRIDLTPLFEYDTGSYQRGSFQFRLAELADLSLETGDHELRIIASDTWNNRTEKRYTVVLTEDLPDLAFQQDVLVYPNPFDPNRTEAEFFVDLNREAHVTIQILTVTGKTIREFTGCTASGPTRLADCRWDGRDADGDWVANGVYLVRATAESFDGTRRDETIGKAIVLRGVARKLR